MQVDDDVIEDDPSGDSQENDGDGGKWEPPKDGSFIPKVRFDEAVGELKDEVRELREDRIRMEERLKAQEKPDKQYNRAELNALVDAEKISRDQADELWDKQLETRITNKLTTHFDEKTQVETQTREVAEELKSYKQLRPDVVVEGSPEREKVREEYRYLLSRGQPDSISTELLALRNIYGPHEKLRRNSNVDRETHKETGGGSPPSQKKEGMPEMSAKERDYYEPLVKNGMYTWKQVGEELKYANPSIRSRLK